jgi:predicted ATPase/class 3 adenylate cyclase
LGLPTGTVTFLFTDIEGSTELWERDEALARHVLVRHDQIIEELVEAEEGMLVRPRGEGDSRFAVFQQAPSAAAAAASIQRAFTDENWPTAEPLKIRMGLHTGNADLREGDYYGSAVNRCARVRSLAHGGQVLLSLATEQLICDYLPQGVELRDLGLYTLKGLKRQEQVFQLVIPDLVSEFPPLKTQVGKRHNLPEQLTPFVGRETEIDAVRQLLFKQGVRLVTLKGPGGMGKTRLSIEVASQSAEEFSDGVRFVALAPLDSADQIVQAFLQALDLRPASQEDPKDFLLQQLQRSELLIVVDNFEHVLEGAPLVRDILENASQVKILATSRERLGLRGESVFDVTGLQFADWQTVDQALSDSCAQLFMQGALQVQPQFELEEADVQHVARICRLIDGAPLALLLSAGWTDVLSPEEIADEVEASLDFLETELRDAPDRQRSLKAVFDASWERLEDPERDLFTRLSVFRGGVTRDAAAGVADAGLRSLARLTDKSFLRREPETGRYEIHEMLRQYGEQLLETADEASQATRMKHASYFSELLAAKEEPLTTGNEAEPLDEIEADIENIRRAWRYLAETGDAESLQKSLFSLWFFHEVRCWLHAGMELFAKTEQSLRASSEGIKIDVVANQLQAAGAFFTVILGFAEKGVTTATHTLDWLNQQGYRNETTYSLLAAGVGNIFLQASSEAITYADELSEVGNGMGHKWWALRGKTIAAGQYIVLGDQEQALRYLEENDQLLADTGGPWNSYWGQNLHSRLAEERGDLAAAKEINQATIDSLQTVSFLRGMQYAYSNLGRISLLLEELDEAELNFTLSLQISQETGQIRDALANLINIARVWKAQGRGADAVEVVAAVLPHSQIDQSSLLIRLSIREEAEALRSELEQELDPSEYQIAWEKGFGEEMEDVAMRILRELETRPQAVLQD